MSGPYEILSVEERVRYIEDLTIPNQAAISALVANLHEESGSHFESPNTLAPAECSAVVDAGSAVSFVTGVEGQMKSDILNSTLLAQLVASEKFDRQEQTLEWYGAYQDVLRHLGWSLQRFHFVHLQNVEGYRTVDNLVTTRAAEYLSGPELDLFRSVVAALHRSRNAAADRLFDSASKRATKASFQIGVASDIGGDATLKISFYSYTVSQDIDNVLFLTFNPTETAVTFLAGKKDMLLKTDIYAGCRDAVLKKLGQSAMSLVMGVEI